MNRSVLTSISFTIAVLIAPQSSWGDFQTLIEQLPEDANTLVLFDMEAILASPLAVKYNWSQNQHSDFAKGIMIVSPNTKHLAMASQMDLEVMRPHWSATMMELSEEPSMLNVTERYGGNVDEINGQKAAVLPNNMYVIKFGKYYAGSMYPADRQKAARWVEEAFAMSGRKPLAPYLAEAQSYLKNTPILMAIDMQHVLSPKFIRSKLDGMKSLQGKKVDLDQLATTLSSVRGATLGLEIGEGIGGGLKVDFGSDITIMNDFAKPLLLECLANHGAMIDEFNDWKVTVTANEVLLKGSLGVSGVHRIFSLLDTPPSLSPQPSESTAAGGKPTQAQMAQATKQYYKSIELLLNDLTGEDKQHQMTTPGLVALWYERYAAKIDALPILHVDPEMVSFATQVTGALRQSQTALRTAGVRTATQITSMQGAEVYNYQYAAGAAVGEFGGFAAGGAYRYQDDPRASLRQDGQQIAQITAQETAKGYSTANNLMQEITVSMADMRKKMTEKYQVEF